MSICKKRQKILNILNINITRESIPDDLLKVLTHDDIANFSKILFHDIQNSSIFRDGSIDPMVFQQDIQIYMYQRMNNIGNQLETCISFKNCDTSILQTSRETGHSIPFKLHLKQTVDAIIQHDILADKKKSSNA